MAIRICAIINADTDCRETYVSFNRERGGFKPGTVNGENF